MRGRRAKRQPTRLVSSAPSAPTASSVPARRHSMHPCETRTCAPIRVMPIDALALGGHGAIVERKAGRFLRQESPGAKQHDRVARVRAANEAHCVPGGLENGACLGRRHGKVSRRCKPLASGAGRGSHVLL